MGGYINIPPKHTSYITLLPENYSITKQKKFKAKYRNNNQKHINNSFIKDKGDIFYL